LWENFFFVERVKLHDKLLDFKSMYFWRTTGPSPKEIDFLEVLDGRIEAFECKLSSKVQTSRHASFFQQKYPESTVAVVSPQDSARFFRDAYARSNTDDASLAAYRQALEIAARRS
ncbi:MAG: DUF4143 domain-containing protein, partial [Duodenibacillus sp.]